MERMIQIAVVTTVIAIILVVNINRYTAIEDVRNEHAFTFGKIERCFHIGLPSVRYLEYSYEINGITYKRSFSDHHFPDCEKNYALYKDKRFWVAYAKKDFSHSVIDLDAEVDLKNPAAPTSLVGFE
jgi:hypothetical protein